MKTAFINARLIDPETKLDTLGGILVDQGKILDIGAHIKKDTIGDTQFTDCERNILCPGLVDLRVVVGAEHKESFETASDAALSGGITTFVCSSESTPLNDNISVLSSIQKKTSEIDRVKIHSFATLTQNQNGKDLCEIGLLSENGVLGFSDGLKPIQDSKTLLRALTYSTMCNALIMQHPSDRSLSEGGHMNKGVLATRLGLSGIPVEAEVIMLERDLRLVEMTNARYHAANISTAESIELIRRAKQKGLKVTCDTAPFYFSLTEHDVTDYRTFTKLMPPLRSDDDRYAIAKAVKDGTIDIITSDHRPEDQDSKRLPFAGASIGAIGLETLLSLSLSMQDETEMEMIDLIERLTLAPAKLLGLQEAGRLKKGGVADFIVFDPNFGWKMDATTLKSKSKNTPYDGRPMTGVVLKTIVNGRTLFSRYK